MIYVLIVDDNDVRAEQTRAILDEVGIPEGNITCATCIMNAKRALTKTKYDVMLLDLVLPKRNGTAPESDGGMDLLQEIMSLEDVYKMPSRVFVLSEFDDAIQRTSELTHELTFAVIKYDSASDEWRSRLKNYLDQIIRIKTEDIKDYDYDAAIICALENPELSEIKRLSFGWEPYNILGDSTDYFIGKYGDKKLICAASYEMGLSSAAILSTKIITVFRPKYLFMTGIAGGADSAELHYGDVMVADPCFDYESGKKIYENGESFFKPDYRQVRLDDTIHQMIRRLSTQRDVLNTIKETCTYEKPPELLQIQMGPFGSGAAVLSDEVVIDSVKNHSRKFLGFDMEAYAVMLSGALSSTPKTIPVVIKAVSDFGTNKNNQYQKYAAYTSAKVLELVLKELFGGT